MNKLKYLDFPEVRQSKNYTCGASALQALLYYYGFSYREDQLEKLLKSNKNSGTSPIDIVSLCKKLGLNVIEKHNMTIDDIRHYLMNQIPILVSFQAWGLSNQYDTYENGHYSIIIGIIGDKIIFEDPSIIGKGYIKIKEFMKRWHDYDKYDHQYLQYGIMIVGQTIKYHSNHIQRIM